MAQPRRSERLNKAISLIPDSPLPATRGFATPAVTALQARPAAAAARGGVPDTRLVPEPGVDDPAPESLELSGATSVASDATTTSPQSQNGQEDGTNEGAHAPHVQDTPDPPERALEPPKDPIESAYKSNSIIEGPKPELPKVQDFIQNYLLPAAAPPVLEDNPSASSAAAALIMDSGVTTIEGPGPASTKSTSTTPGYKNKINTLALFRANLLPIQHVNAWKGVDDREAVLLPSCHGVLV